jgi:eukaryotic-like serine/threonine-protein kinase
VTERPAISFDRLSAVFGAALELPVADRDAYVRRASNGDEALVAEVLELLRYESGPNDFFAPFGTLGDAGRRTLDSSDRTGREIGKYRLEQLLGRGGMGAVYLAERTDGEFAHRVALKLLPLGLDSEIARARFASERQILATLVHPNIAQLYDGGVADDGTPYFVLELVDGRPLDEFCDRGRLTVFARVRLFLDACRAVEYAHQNLVVHRDLKPSNMLVTTRGELKLVDFGIARVVPESGEGAPSELTSAARVLTPGYASPEQLRGDPITTASDVYSLGVVLHRLLTGVSPFDAATTLAHDASPDPVARFRSTEGRGMQVAADRQISPAALTRLLAGDLGAILMKAIDPEPSRRYANAGELGADLERWLGHEPVMARSPSTLYRTRKFVRRNRFVVAAVTLVLGALGFAAVTATAQARRIAVERDRARLEAAKATAFAEVVQSANPLADGRRDASVSEALTWAVTQLDASRYPVSVDAAVRTAIGVTFFNQGRYAEAAPLIRSAYEARRRLFPRPHADLAESLHWMGQIHAFHLDVDSGRSYLEQGLRMRVETLGPDELPNAESSMALADLLGEGDDGAPETIVHPTLGRVDAEGLLQSALAIYRRADSSRAHVANALGRLGVLAQQRGNLGLAEEYHGQALALRDSVYVRPHPLLGESLYNVAQLRAARGEYAAAESLYRRSLQIAQATLGTHERVASVELALAIALDSLDRVEEAGAIYRQAVTTYERALGPNDPWTGIAYGYLGTFEMARGRPDSALVHFRRALAINDARYGTTSWYAASSRGMVGWAMAQSGRRGEGLALLQRAIGELSGALGSEHERVQAMQRRRTELERP